MRNKGFSLLELIVVVMIASLVAALTVPALSRFSSSVELKAAVKKVSSILRYYRSKAVNQGKDYQIFFDPDLLVVRIQPVISEMEKEEIVAKEESLPVTRYPLSSGIRIKEVKIDSMRYPSDFPVIEFYSNGGSNGGIVTLNCPNGQEYKIEVNFLTGLVTVQKILT
jgi:general secretion pathway protein H